VNEGSCEIIYDIKADDTRIEYWMRMAQWVCPALRTKWIDTIPYGHTQARHGVDAAPNNCRLETIALKFPPVRAGPRMDGVLRRAATDAFGYRLARDAGSARRSSSAACIG
jgi:hypothetical protein